MSHLSFLTEERLRVIILLHEIIFWSTLRVALQNVETLNKLNFLHDSSAIFGAAFVLQAASGARLMEAVELKTYAWLDRHRKANFTEVGRRFKSTLLMVVKAHGPHCLPTVSGLDQPLHRSLHHHPLSAQGEALSNCEGSQNSFLALQRLAVTLLGPLKKSNTACYALIGNGRSAYVSIEK
ncbi:hypothetical protein BDN70DRAFT_186369 [Pholiota conissans]|uniref:Uncharacterized protein n=1 Tax=Pholiota conissans TaxID=109636 RepID=A0A9P5YVI5_9AGAR|nr:hypothetical protein BDN70DRAFT_186369 [Pholiota conissans]